MSGQEFQVHKSSAKIKGFGEPKLEKSQSGMNCWNLSGPEKRAKHVHYRYTAVLYPLGSQRPLCLNLILIVDTDSTSHTMIMSTPPLQQYEFLISRPTKRPYEKTPANDIYPTTTLLVWKTPQAPALASFWPIAMWKVDDRPVPWSSGLCFLSLRHCQYEETSKHKTHVGMIVKYSKHIFIHWMICIRRQCLIDL